MSKDGQDIINKRAEQMFESAIKELGVCALCGLEGKRLRACQAQVIETQNYYILQSYQTYVACISKGTGECADVLRKVYGFTRSSAKQIAYFRSDYGATMTATWRDKD